MNVCSFSNMEAEVSNHVTIDDIKVYLFIIIDANVRENIITALNC